MSDTDDRLDRFGREATGQGTRQDSVNVMACGSCGDTCIAMSLSATMMCPSCGSVWPSPQRSKLSAALARIAVLEAELARVREQGEVERAIMLDLEESAIYAGEMMNDPTVASGVAFATHVYTIAHWLNSPACRKNHPQWEPTPSADAVRRSKEDPTTEDADWWEDLLVAFHAHRTSAGAKP